MPVVRKSLWLGTRLGVVAGALYFTTDMGVWGNSSQTEAIYRQLYEAATPFVNQTPVKMSELPRVSDYSRSVALLWNNGVISTTDFLLHLPSHCSKWASATYDQIDKLISDPSPPTS